MAEPYGYVTAKSALEHQSFSAMLLAFFDASVFLGSACGANEILLVQVVIFRSMAFVCPSEVWIAALSQISQS